MAGTSFVSTNENLISEIEVKNLLKPIKVEIPLTKAIQNP
jgi:hypothetical protein